MSKSVTLPLSVFYLIKVNYKRYLHTRARLSTSVMDPVETGEKVLIYILNQKILNEGTHCQNVIFTYNLSIILKNRAGNVIILRTFHAGTSSKKTSIAYEKKMTQWV